MPILRQAPRPAVLGMELRALLGNDELSTRQKELRRSRVEKLGERAVRDIWDTLMR